MSVAVPSRLVEERNSSRNLSPVFRPVGLRLQLLGTSVVTSASGPMMSIVSA